MYAFIQDYTKNIVGNKKYRLPNTKYYFLVKSKIRVEKCLVYPISRKRSRALQSNINRKNCVVPYS